MKKGFIIFVFLFISLAINAQQRVKDTVKTEIVNVVTAYNPKIADASKIKQNPKIELLKESEKKELKYTISSVPVASTFIPKTGAIREINVGARERVYNNYLAAGYGNYSSPYFETFLYRNDNSKNEIGFSAKYLASDDNVKNTILKSNFSNFKAGVFYRKNDRDFDWKVALNSERNKYNWYGLSNLNFNSTTLNAIQEQQKYNFLELIGDIKFKDGYIDYANLNVSYFTDAFSSKEKIISLTARFNVPLNSRKRKSNLVKINTNLELLNGSFEKNYQSISPNDYSFFTGRINPEYNWSSNGLTVKAGFNFAFSSNFEQKSSKVYVYPNILFQKSIITKYLNIFGGFVGGLHTNTYKKFTENNPYVSPTLSINQTNEKSNLFIGFKGKFGSNTRFNLKANIKNEDNKPLFIKNNSKSDGTTQSFNGETLLGYEYGNSFSIFYDDIKTTSFYAELEYDFSEKITLKPSILLSSYSLTNALDSYNLPEAQASFVGTYKNKKWFAEANIFYIGNRKDLLYTNIYPSTITQLENLKSFLDVNLSGGYHFNDEFSTFLKLNNLLDNNYQQFSGFNVQGLQILGGFTWKFDF